jgi:hypothetical protein
MLYAESPMSSTPLTKDKWHQQQQQHSAPAYSYNNTARSTNPATTDLMTPQSIRTSQPQFAAAMAAPAGYQLVPTAISNYNNTQQQQPGISHMQAIPIMANIQPQSQPFYPIQQQQWYPPPQQTTYGGNQQQPMQFDDLQQLPANQFQQQQQQPPPPQQQPLFYQPQHQYPTPAQQFQQPPQHHQNLPPYLPSQQQMFKNRKERRAALNKNTPNTW